MSEGFSFSNLDTLSDVAANMLLGVNLTEDRSKCFTTKLKRLGSPLCLSSVEKTDIMATSVESSNETEDAVVPVEKKNTKCVDTNSINTVIHTSDVVSRYAKNVNNSIKDIAIINDLKLSKRRLYLPKQVRLIYEPTISPKESLKGRPYSNSINARFYLHDSINDLYCYLKNATHFNYSNPYQSDSINFKSKFKNIKNSPKFKKIIFNLPSKVDLGRKLNHAFGISNFKFIKIIRNIKGRLIKIESINKPSNTIINSEWIKTKVCYPRYKSNMKIHLIKPNCNSNEIIYNERRMYELDIENINLNCNSIKIIN